MNILPIATHWAKTLSALTLALAVTSLNAQVKSAPIPSEPVQATPPNNDSDMSSGQKHLPTPKEHEPVQAYCPNGLENILPGDFYSCEAKYYFSEHHVEHSVEELTEAARWADKGSQYALGLMYFDGDISGIAKNRPLGLAWLALAAERNNPDYIRAYAIARAQATPEEVVQGTQLWKRMYEEYGDKFAATRAVRQFNRGIQLVDESAQDGGIGYVNGFSPYPMSAFALSKQLHAEADNDFSDWRGTVTVGKPIWELAKHPDAPAPSTSATPRP